MLIDTRKECEKQINVLQKFKSNQKKLKQDLAHVQSRTENLEKQINGLEKFKSNQQNLEQDLAHVQSRTENLEKQINGLEKFKSNQQNLEQDLAHVQSQLETKINRVGIQSMNSVETRFDQNLRQIRKDLRTSNTKITELESRLKNKDEKRSRWRFW